MPTTIRLAPPELLPVPPAPPPFRDQPPPELELPPPPADVAFEEPELRLPPPPVVREAPRPPVFGNPAHGHDWSGERPFKVCAGCATKVTTYVGFTTMLGSRIAHLSKAIRRRDD